MSISNISCKILVVAALFAVGGCSDYKQKKEWDGIDYSKVRDRDKYENDSNYTSPSVIGCTSDDLYTCN
jgi:hypothetical protein